jgi:hypothetical protein
MSIGTRPFKVAYHHPTERQARSSSGDRREWYTEGRSALCVIEMAENLVKVRFNLDPNAWHGHGSETLWAAPAPEKEWSIFRIMNSPFFTMGIGHLDFVTATPSEIDGIFDFDRVEKRGGHSTFMMLVAPTEKRFGAYWKLVEKVDCSYERMQIKLSIGHRLLFSVDVPPSADLDEVVELLERGKNDDVWIFQAGHEFREERKLGM